MSGRESVFTQFVRFLSRIPHRVGQLIRMADSVDQLARDMQLLKIRTRDLARGQNIPLAGHVMATRTAAGLRMFIDDRDTGSGFDILGTGYVEPYNTRLFQKLIRPGSTFLDVGANFGYYTLLGASLVRNSGRVFSFEANDNLIPLLQRSIFSNGFTNRVTLHHTAVSDCPGMAEFGFSFGGIGGGSLHGGESSDPALTKIQVQLARIDDLLPPDTVVDFIKIDVEGHELQALRGMEATLRRSPDVAIVFEYFTNMQEGGAAGMQVPNYLRSLGFGLWRVGKTGLLEDISDAELANGGDLYLLASRKKPNDREIVLGPNALHLPTRDRARIGDTLMYGPYMALAQGRYEVVVEGAVRGLLRVAATHEVGLELASRAISGSGQSFEFVASQDIREFEIVAHALTPDASLRLDRVRVIDRS